MRSNMRRLRSESSLSRHTGSTQNANRIHDIQYNTKYTCDTGQTRNKLLAHDGGKSSSQRLSLVELHAFVGVVGALFRVRPARPTTGAQRDACGIYQVLHTGSGTFTLGLAASFLRV